MNIRVTGSLTGTNIWPRIGFHILTRESLQLSTFSLYHNDVGLWKLVNHQHSCLSKNSYAVRAKQSTIKYAIYIYIYNQDFTTYLWLFIKIKRNVSNNGVISNRFQQSLLPNTEGISKKNREKTSQNKKTLHKNQAGRKQDVMRPT